MALSTENRPISVSEMAASENITVEDVLWRATRGDFRLAIPLDYHLEMAILGASYHGQNGLSRVYWHYLPVIEAEAIASAYILGERKFHIFYLVYADGVIKSPADVQKVNRGIMRRSIYLEVDSFHIMDNVGKQREVAVRKKIKGQRKIAKFFGHKHYKSFVFLREKYGNDFPVHQDINGRWWAYEDDLEKFKDNFLQKK